MNDEPATLEDALHNCEQVSESRRRKIAELTQQRDYLIAALKLIADGPWPDDCEGPEGQCRFDEGVARAALKKVGAGTTATEGHNVQSDRLAEDKQEERK